MSVPYKTGSQAIIEAAGGQIAFAVGYMSEIEPLINAGKLVPLAVYGRCMAPSVCPSCPTCRPVPLLPNTGFTSCVRCCGVYSACGWVGVGSGEADQVKRQPRGVRGPDRSSPCPALPSECRARLTARSTVRDDRRMPATADPLREAIVDSALELGEQLGWDAVHLHEVAQALGIGLADIAGRFAHKDAIAEAWFDRADQALLAAPAAPGWSQLDPIERLHAAVFAWLDALAPHRRLSGQMLRYKLQPEHLHLQALGAVRVSRTVQTLREVAGLKSAGWRREAEEAALTAMYLAALLSWLRDDSAGAAASRDRLRRWLARADFVARRLP